MKYILYILMTVLLGSYVGRACAETIVLKSGKMIEGKILERTKDHIKVDYKPVPLYYSWDNIDTIDGQPVPGRVQKASQQTAAPTLLDAKDKEIESLRSQLREYQQFKEEFVRLKQAYMKLQARYFNNLGGTFLYEKAFDKAAAAFQEALDIDPWNLEACFNLGMLYDEYLKDAKAAVSFYERYLVLAPNAEDQREIEDRIAKLKY
jgi:tetratricopeptide (TPR) repeat protein